MSDEFTIALAAIFLGAIPVNLYVAREFHREAVVEPHIPSLSLLSNLVTVLAVAAIVLGVVSFLSVVFLTTGIRLVPMPGATVALIAVLLMVSFANVLALRYLRRMRAES